VNIKGPSTKRAVIQYLDGTMVRIPASVTVGGARQIAALKRSKYLLISEGVRVLGLLCTDDLAQAGENDPVGRWARRNWSGVAADTDAGTALDMMERSRLPFLPVTAGAMVLGIVTQARLREVIAPLRKGRPSMGSDGGAGPMAQFNAFWSPSETEDPRLESSRRAA